MAVRIVAEAGSTHKGSLELAKKQARGARDAGADAVKYIMTTADELVADRTIQYGDEGSLYDIIKSYELKDDEWHELAAYCRGIGIEMYASVGTIDKVPLARKLGFERIKAGGGWDSRNFPLLEACAQTTLPIEVDICAVIAPEVALIIDTITAVQHGWHIAKTADNAAPLTLIYESHGPVNIRSIPYMRDTFGLPVGYSTNDTEWENDYRTLAAGAMQIERRIKPDDSPGHQRETALSPEAFKQWAKYVREEDERLGTPALVPSLADVSAKQKYFTSLRFSRNAKAGEIVTEDMLCGRRPGDGLSPLYSYLFIGRPLARDVSENEALTYETCEAVVE